MFNTDEEIRAWAVEKIIDFAKLDDQGINCSSNNILILTSHAEILVNYIKSGKTK
jgi:hypothetical protein